MKKERKNSEMEETILFFRANEPLSRSEDARFERRIYGGHVPAHVTRLRAMNSSLASLSASRFDCASACPTRAPHTLAPSCVSLKDASVRSEPRGGFRLIVRPILLHPLVLIHRIVKWRWPNLLLYRIMVILRGQRWERCDRMRDWTNITIIFDSFLDEDFALYFEIRIVLLEYKVREREIN